MGYDQGMKDGGWNTVCMIIFRSTSRFTSSFYISVSELPIPIGDHTKSLILLITNLLYPATG